MFLAVLTPTVTVVLPWYAGWVCRKMSRGWAAGVIEAQETAQKRWFAEKREQLSKVFQKSNTGEK
jgi:hypothetical protein